MSKDKLLIFTERESKNRIIIPLSQLKEIKETDRKNLLKINGYEVRCNLEELLSLVQCAYEIVDFKHICEEN